MRKLRSIALALLLLAPQSWAADELPPSGEELAQAILSAYDRLESYCDRGKFLDRALWLRVTRCYSANGYYKVDEQVLNRNKNRTVIWGTPDAGFVWVSHRTWRTVTNAYREGPSRTNGIDSLPDDLASSVLGAILSDSRRESLRAALAGFAIASDQPEPDLILLRRMSPKLGPEGKPVAIEELWLRRADHLVWRYERTYGERVTRAVRLASLSVNDPKSLDVDFKAPITARYSLRSRPVQYFFGMTMLGVFTGLCAGLIHSWFVRQSFAVQPTPTLWSRTTKIYLGAWGLIAVGVVAHAAFYLLMIMFRPEASKGFTWGLAYLLAHSVWALLILLILGGFILGWHAARLIGWQVLKSKENRGM
jgi:hypothetical protein